LHPSFAPQAFPAQLGVQLHVPPLQESGLAHAFPAQHACPLPPQFPQLVPHVVPVSHDTHATPPLPQAF
jgi:hypothetical protein